MTFEQWKAKVDACLLRKCGMTSEDLPDWDYYGAYQNHDAPQVAANDALESAKEF